MKQKQCTSLPDTAGDFLPTSSSDTRQLSLLSGIPTPAKSSENEQQTDGSLVCECGKGTFNCLIHPNTPEKWTAFMQDSLAKTLALLESRQVYMREPDQVFTEKSCVSLAWYDQSSFSWKTYQQSLVTGWEPYSETWPRWGMTVAGSAFVHPMSERRITETDGFYWPTPVKSDCVARRPSKNWEGTSDLPSVVWTLNGGAMNPDKPPAKLNADWVDWLMGFPIGWTELKAAVTPKSRSKRQQPTDSSEESDAP